MTAASPQVPPRADHQAADRASWMLVGGLVGLSLVVEVASRRADAARNALAQNWMEILLLESTSHLAILGLAGLAPLLLNRIAGHRPLWRSALIGHGAGFAAFLAGHLAITFGAREILFPRLIGRPYELNLWSLEVWTYEAPKDVLAYCAIMAAFLIGRRLHKLAPEPGVGSAPIERLVLRSGAATFVVAASEVVWAQSAGNYVEVHTASTSFLARMPLAQLEAALLAAGGRHARVHRSHVVNLDHVRSVLPTGEGDVTIVLSTGAALAGSRRYRGRLAALEARPAAPQN